MFLVSLERSWSVDIENGSHIGHLDICNPSYGKKKGQDSTGSLPPTTKSRESTSSRCSIWECDRRWKALEENYNFGLDLVVIGLCSRELWAPKVPRLQPGQFRDSGPWWVKWVQGCSWLVPTPKGCIMSSNQLVVGFDADSSKWITWPLPSLILGTYSTTLYPFLVLEVGSVPQVPTFRNST